MVMGNSRFSLVLCSIIWWRFQLWDTN